MLPRFVNTNILRKSINNKRTRVFDLRRCFFTNALSACIIMFVLCDLFLEIVLLKLFKGLNHCKDDISQLL